MLATAKAKRGDPKNSKAETPELESTHGSADQYIRDLKKAIRTVRKHWREAQRLTRFYNVEAQRKAAAVKSAERRLWLHVSKQMVKNDMVDAIQSGSQEILEEAALNNMPGFEQEDKERALEDNVKKWGEQNGGLVADDKAKSDVKSFMKVVTSQQERALEKAGGVEIPNVLATMASPKFWQKMKDDSSVLAKKVAKSQKQALQTVLKHLDKHPDAKPNPNEVSSLNGAQPRNTLHIAHTRQKLYESKVRDELDNSVAKKIDLYERPTSTTDTR